VLYLILCQIIGNFNTKYVLQFVNKNDLFLKATAEGPGGIRSPTSVEVGDYTTMYVDHATRAQKIK
jgi:hypothetical protein